MKKLAILFVMLCFTEAGISETRVTHYTPQQLHKKSALVFRGVVTKIETVEKHNKTFPTDAEVSEILKGELNKKDLTFAYKHPRRGVISREEFNTPKVGEEGVFYLQAQGENLILIGYIKTEQDGVDLPATAPGSEMKGGDSQLDRHLIYTERSPSEGDKPRPIYEDDSFKMVAVGYGNVSNPTNPGFYVFRKKTKNWIRFERVPTLGATFGRSPTDEEVEKAGKTPVSIGWDFRTLSEKAYVDFPLKSGGFLFFPDKVESKEMEYVLHFNSGWKIMGVETTLKLRIDQLTNPEPEQGSGGNG